MWTTLKNKDFSIFVYSQTISQFGDKLDYIALIGIVGLFPETRTPFLLSLLAIFMTLPVLIFGPVAGVLVDRWHKKHVLVVCDSLRMLCALCIPVLFLATRNIYPVFAVVFFMFLLTLIFNAARSAIIPNLVVKKDILQANSLINFVGRAATFLGMLAGGFIVDWKIWHSLVGLPGWAVAFFLDAITFGSSAIMLYLMKVTLPGPPKRKEHLEARSFLILIRDGLRNVWRELKHAVQIIFRERDIGFAMFSILLMIIAGSMIYVLVIPTVQTEMAWGTFGVGGLASIGALGLLVGAWLVGVFGHRFNLKTMLIGCFVVLGLALVCFPLLNQFWMFAAVTFVGGVAVSPIFIGQETLIHHSAHEFMRGRMFSMRDWLLNGSFVLVALIIGALTSITTKDILFIVVGVLLTVTAILSWFLLVRVRSGRSSKNR